MTILYIFIGLVVIALIQTVYKHYFSKDSPYFQIRKRLEDDLKQFDFSGDWRKRQEVNLQLHWLETIKEVETRDFLGTKKQESEGEILSKLTEKDMRFPTKWRLEDLYHYPFISSIIADFGTTLADNEHKVMYRPESILPYPKDIINKAYYYMFDYLNCNEPPYLIKDKKKIADNLNATHILLSTMFIDTGNEELPQDIFDNYRKGKEIIDNKKLASELDELDLIDWLDGKGWLIKGATYAEENQMEYAIKCYLKSLEFDKKNSMTLHCLGLAYNKLKNYTKAIEAYKQALVYNPDKVELLYNLAESFHDSEKYDEAIQNYNRVIELDPKHGKAYYNLAVLYSEINQPKLIQENLQMAASLGITEAKKYLDSNEDKSST